MTPIVFRHPIQRDAVYAAIPPARRRQLHAAAAEVVSWAASWSHRVALDLRRAERRHMSFGHGIHFCMGAPLARREGQIAFRSLLGRCSDLALAVDRAS